MTMPSSLPANWTTGQTFPAGSENNVESAINWLMYLELNDNFGGDSNGAPATALSGQSYSAAQTTSGAALSVTSGLLSNSNAAASTGWINATLGGSVVYLEADFAFGSSGSTTNQTLILGSSSAALTGTISTITTSPCYVVFGNTGYSVYYWSSSTQTQIGSTISYAARGTTSQHVEVTIDATNNYIWVRGPDGLVNGFTNANVTGSNTHAVLGAAHTASSDHAVNISRWAASSQLLTNQTPFYYRAQALKQDAVELTALTTSLTSQIAPSVYSTTIGNGSTTTFTINHNLGTRNVTVTIYDTSTFEAVRVPPILTDTNNLSLTFATAPTSGQYAVVVLGGALISQPGVFTQTIGDTSTTTFTITHNLGTRAVGVTGYDTSTFKRVRFDVAFTTTNTVTLTFGTAPSTNGVAITVQGGNLASTGVAMANISDATTIGRQLLGATNAASALALLTPLQNAVGAVVATSESTTSTSYADLATTTDQVTVTIGSSGIALVLFSANLTTAGAITFMGYAISGANTVAAADAKAVTFWSPSSGATSTPTGIFLETGLSSGSTTFKLKYRSNNGTSETFANRRIAVIPL